MGHRLTASRIGRQQHSQSRVAVRRMMQSPASVATQPLTTAASVVEVTTIPPTSVAAEPTPAAANSVETTSRQQPTRGSATWS